MEYKSNRNIAYSCKYHIVWCVKYRRKVLSEAVSFRLKQIISKVCEEKSCELFEVETDKDHVHILVEIDPQFGVHRLVKAVKGRSSRLLREEFPKLNTKLPSLWTNSYFVSSVGGAPFSQIKKYIQEQKTSQRP